MRVDTNLYELPSYNLESGVSIFEFETVFLPYGDFKKERDGWIDWLLRLLLLLLLRSTGVQYGCLGFDVKS